MSPDKARNDGFIYEQAGTFDICAWSASLGRIGGRSERMLQPESRDQVT
jgi:hypothetical protein